MIISKFKRELNGDISEILLNTGEVMQNTKYLSGLEEKTVTENGTYTPSTGKVGFSKVVVNVPTSGAIKLYAWKSSEEHLLFTAVETLTADTKVFGCSDDRVGFLTLPSDVSSFCTIDTVNNVIKMTFSEEEETLERDSEDDINLF